MKQVKPNTLVLITLTLLLVTSGLFYQLGGRSWLAEYKQMKPIILATEKQPAAEKKANNKEAFAVPDFDSIPNDHLGESIRRGKTT